jgi:hypothetical protein
MCLFKDVLHVLDLVYQLLSFPAIGKLGLEKSFKHARPRVKTDTKSIASMLEKYAPKTTCPSLPRIDLI